jgi:hypothetical protein
MSIVRSAPKAKASLEFRERREEDEMACIGGAVLAVLLIMEV